MCLVGFGVPNAKHRLNFSTVYFNPTKTDMTVVKTNFFLGAILLPFNCCNKQNKPIFYLHD